MNKGDLNKKIINGTKWSLFAELVTKLITPIMNIILARLLAPEIFGIITSITIIISFAEMLSDAGFQKFIIQYEFKNEVEKDQYLNLSFWLNLFLSILMWIIIAVFNQQFASMLGLSGLGNVLIIAAFQIPLYGITSIQLSIFRREFKFKQYFIIRLITSFIPLFITVPLAFLGFKYWSLIIGTISGLIVSSFLYFLFSSWKPKLKINFHLFKNMWKFVSWTILESFFIWLTSWIDTILLTIFITDTYFTGLFKTSVVSITGILGIITSAFIPVFYSALSRLQKDDEKYFNLFYLFQKFMAYLLIPLGIGIYFFRDFITSVLLGNQWLEGAYIIGIWGLTSVIVFLFSNLNSEVFRSKGKPQLSLLVQILHLVVLVPVVIIGLNRGFWDFVKYRTFIRIQMAIVSFIVFHIVLKQSMKKTILNIIKPLIVSVPMLIFILLTSKISGYFWIDVALISSSIIIYGATLLLLAKKDILSMISIVKNKE